MSFIFSTDLYRFEVRLEIYDGPAWYLVLFPCPRLTPRRHRQAHGLLSPLYHPLPSLSSFGAACVKLCGLLPRWTESPSLLSRLVSVVGNIKFVLMWIWTLNRQLYFRTQWVLSQRRSQFKHVYCRGADRAPQITASATRDRRRAHWHT